MKRFAKTISLAACLVFLCGATAMAADAVVVESKVVAPGAVGVTLGVFISNDQDATGYVQPLEFREQTAGSYITTAFARAFNAAGRMKTSALGDASACSPNASIVQGRYPTPQALNTCGPGPGNGYQATAAQVDFISPDGTLLATVSTGDPNAGDCIALPAGSDGATASYVFTFNVTAVQGTFIVDTCCTTPANHLGYVNMQNAIVNMAFTPGIVTIFQPPNACPVVTVDNAVVNATVGSPAANDADATDADGAPPITFYLASGPGSVDPSTGAWSYTPLCSDVPSFQVCIGAFDAGKSPGQCTQSACFTVNVSPAPLSIQCSNQSGHWGTVLSFSPTLAGGCPPYSLSIVSGPGEIDGQTWDWPSGCGDVGCQSVTLRVTDAVQGTQDCTFQACVTNTVPTCSAIPPSLPGAGGVHTVDLGDLIQADGDALTYAYVSGLPGTWAAPTIVGDQFSATRPGGDGASYTVVYTVSDGCATVTCSFDVIFENPCIKIVKQGTDSAYGCWFNGTTATVCVVASAGAVPDDAGGYDFLICYDQSGLSFLGASGGPEGWEYFTYRTGLFGGNCGGGCPDGYVRLVSIADMNNGNPVDPADLNLDDKVLACMSFYVTSDRNFINSCLHVGFCSFDCGDNSVSSASGDTLWVPRDGVNFHPEYSCDGNNKPGIEVLPEISFCPGAICVCEPPDDRGDINLNGIANEIGDAVLFTNYFIYGSSVWTPPYEAVQHLATDINDDGIVLTVADLIYLIRIITGDEQPFPPGTGNGSPKLSPYANSVDVTSDVSNGAISVRTNSSVEVGAALLVFRYSDLTVGAPVLSNNSGLEIRSNAANGELRVLVYGSVEAAGSRLSSGANSLVTIPVSGNGSIELVESQFSDYNGALLSVNSASTVLPKEYSLLQNYPNPFNAGTVIPFSLVEESEYSLTIYNVAGQSVRTFNGTGIGNVSVTWDGRTVEGTEVASGMYFYRVTAGAFTATKKMVLLK